MYVFHGRILDGKVSRICKKDKFLNGLDDLESGICWQEKEEVNTNDDLSYSIVGNDEIRVGETSIYSIEPKNKAEFVIANYLINDRIIQYEKIDDYSIKIKVLKPNELIKIKCKINETEVTKNVLTVR